MISSGSNAKIKEIVKLQKSARQRRKQGVFIAEGIRLVREADICGRLQQLYFSESVWQDGGEDCRELADRYPFEVVADSVFHAMTDTVTPQGVLGIVQMPAYELDAILQDEGRSFLLLDDLRDPGNLGTIMRTAEGAGMSGVILSRESVDLFNPKVVRSTMGSVFRMPFYYAEDLPEVIRRLKKLKISVYGTMMQGSILYDEPDYCGGAAILIGNEANGISEETAAELSARVRIPMSGKLESLNAAVAASILMYEVARQKRKTD